jgi:hypothetical protein
MRGGGGDMPQAWGGGMRGVCGGGGILQVRRLACAV